jgi:hypothetical protein
VHDISVIWSTGERNLGWIVAEFVSRGGKGMVERSEFHASCLDIDVTILLYLRVAQMAPMPKMVATSPKTMFRILLSNGSYLC